MPRMPAGRQRVQCSELFIPGRTSKVGRILRGEDVSNLPGRTLAIWADVHMQAPGVGR